MQHLSGEPINANGLSEVGYPSSEEKQKTGMHLLIRVHSSSRQNAESSSIVLY